MLEGKGRGLGLMGDYEGVENWYGGRIQQIARLNKSTTGYTLRIEKPEKIRSYEIARFHSSRRIMQVRIPKDLVGRDREGIQEYLRAKFVICGRVFVAFHPKDRSVYLIETDEDLERQSDCSYGDHLRMSLQQFVQLHNPLELNDGQVG
jgi:RNA-dependent RNA polymerase